MNEYMEVNYLHLDFHFTSKPRATEILDKHSFPVVKPISRKPSIEAAALERARGRRVNLSLRSHGLNFIAGNKYFPDR